MYKPPRNYYLRRSTETKGIDDLWQADLVEMTGVSKLNSGYRYMLTTVDTFSKYAWAVLLRDKSGGTLAKAFRVILAERMPAHLQTDKGREFYNKPFRNLT
jgi:hypothetical protein